MHKTISASFSAGPRKGLRRYNTVGFQNRRRNRESFAIRESDHAIGKVAGRAAAHWLFISKNGSDVCSGVLTQTV